LPARSLVEDAAQAQAMAEHDKIRLWYSCVSRATYFDIAVDSYAVLAKPHTRHKTATTFLSGLS